MSATDEFLRQDLHSLYVNHRGWLQAWLRRKLGCSHHADDLAQDTFVQVLSGERGQAIKEPRAYLTTIAQRILFNFWRRRDLERAYLDALSVLPEAAIPSLEDQALVFEALEIIDRALDQLPAKARQVFILSQLHELSYRDIAERLNIPVITVRRHMKRAIYACCQL